MSTWRPDSTTCGCRRATGSTRLNGRAGHHSIAVNHQWRICFRFVDGAAYDVEVTDYH